jgi:hypothetical protein
MSGVGSVLGLEFPQTFVGREWVSYRAQIDAYAPRVSETITEYTSNSQPRLARTACCILRVNCMSDIDCILPF